VWPGLKANLIDVQEQRLAAMDRYGIEMMILSLNAPAVQAIPDTARAKDVARRANDLLAEHVARRPDRFAAFAALPLQDPAAATAELTRCVRDLGFKGALVNGFSQIGDPDNCAYYDVPAYADFWAEVAALDVPFYLHPRNPAPSQMKIYEGHAWLLGPTWAFGAETAVHALRLIGSGLFDRHPNLAIILGHLGEGLPYSLWRIDNRNAWTKTPHNYAAKRTVTDYFRENFYLTTSGNFHTPTMISAIQEIGADRVLFSTDYPFEAIADAAEWFDSSSIGETDRAKIGRENAIRLFKLDL
jgi:2,3-dihydroxybenzoate decarboxylase